MRNVVEMTAGELSPQGQTSGLSAALGASTLQSVPEAYKTAAPSGQWSAEPGSSVAATHATIPCRSEVGAAATAAVIVPPSLQQSKAGATAEATLPGRLKQSAAGAAATVSVTPGLHQCGAI